MNTGQVIQVAITMPIGVILTIVGLLMLAASEPKSRPLDLSYFWGTFLTLLGFAIVCANVADIARLSGC